MATPINVFICYKKMLSGEKPNEKARMLHLLLKQDQEEFDPWIDASGLPTGLPWETGIYYHILASDVLLVLVGPGTSESQWVRREIAVATALGITIVPFGFDLTDDELAKELKALDIGQLQGKVTTNIDPSRGKALLAELHADLESASALTREKQKDMLRPLLARQNPPSPKADDNQRAATFTLRADKRSIPLHIASGDVSRVREIDVLVNSENDYMQMARFFESRTVSSILRRRGARVRDGKYEDTIQQELDWQLRDRGRPVHVAEVFVTSAGAPGSDLVKVNKARYVFHVAAVQAVDAEGRVIPFKQQDQIEDCVRGVLSKLAEVNRMQGVISPPDTEQRKEQEKRRDQGQGIARSVLLPLFGTGQGGSTPAEAIDPMLTGLTDFLEDQDNSELAAVLSEIYISAFKQQDLKDVVEFLRARLP